MNLSTNQWVAVAAIVGVAWWYRAMWWPQLRAMLGSMVPTPSPNPTPAPRIDPERIDAPQTQALADRIMAFVRLRGCCEKAGCTEAIAALDGHVMPHLMHTGGEHEGGTL